MWGVRKKTTSIISLIVIDWGHPEYWKKCRKKFINNNFKHKSKALTVFTSLPNNFISKCQPLKKQPHKQIKPYTPIRGLFKAQKLKPCKLL